VIAEFKRRSPSAGALHEDPDLETIVGAYRDGGAAALSVLTEGPNFGGSLEDLRAARAICELPLLRKDFIVDRYQLEESLAAGADAVLLIVAALAPQELASLHGAARSMGLDVLVEVARSRRAGSRARPRRRHHRNQQPRPAGLQRRRGAHRAPDRPRPARGDGRLGVWNRHRRAARKLHERGVQGVLVGESLMRSADPERSLRELQTFSPAQDDL